MRRSHHQPHQTTKPANNNNDLFMRHMPSGIREVQILWDSLNNEFKVCFVQWNLYLTLLMRPRTQDYICLGPTKKKKNSGYYAVK